MSSATNSLGESTSTLLQLLSLLAPEPIPLRLFTITSESMNPLLDPNGFRNVFSLLINLNHEPTNTEIAAILNDLIASNHVAILDGKVQIHEQAREAALKSIDVSSKQRLIRGDFDVLYSVLALDYDQSRVDDNVLNHTLYILDTVANDSANWKSIDCGLGQRLNELYELVHRLQASKKSSML